jgi:hypothetical protein
LSRQLFPSLGVVRLYPLSLAYQALSFARQPGDLFP